MLFATSFGEAIQNSDPWVLALFSAIPLFVKFLAGKFPAFAWLWAIVEKLIPSPPPPDPLKPNPDTPAPSGPLADALRAAFERLLAKLLKKHEEKQMGDFAATLAQIEAMAEAK